MKLTFLIFLISFLIPFGSILQTEKDKMSANDVINKIKHEVTCDWAEQTVDTFKSGNPDDKVTGIVTCMFANMNVLKEAVANNCNLIITHEPVFYNHYDETANVENYDVFKDKFRYIKENNLIIFRYHDHIHRTQPDGIYEGMIEKLGWESNKVDGSSLFFQFEKQTLSQFVNKLSQVFNSKDFHVIGEKDLEITKVALSVGSPGSQSHFRLLQDNKTEVLVAGEAPQWETYEFVNDAVLQGKKKAVIFLGHIYSEESGMKYCAEWLKTFIKDIPIRYFENGQVYWSPN